MTDKELKRWSRLGFTDPVASSGGGIGIATDCVGGTDFGAGYGSCISARTPALIIRGRAPASRLGAAAATIVIRHDR
jgi:hypothetical protein